jgi:hypothetical protein
VVWASLLKESLKVVYRRPHLALATTYGGRATRYTRATRFLIVTIGHGFNPLKTLLASLLVTPGALFDILGGIVGQHPATADRGCLFAS